MLTAAEHRAPALDWLLRACRFWLTGDPADRPPGGGVDWRLVAELGYFHDLDPLLHHLAGDGVLSLAAGLPERVRRQWEASYFRNFVFNSELLDLLARFLAGCTERGLPAVVFKGPVTAARGWGGAALRIMADVDLICRRGDLAELGELAAGCGFTAGPQTAVHHLALRHRELPASLELHFELYDVLEDADRLAGSVLSAPAVVELEGHRLPAPTPEAAAVLDLAHLLEHDLELGLKPFLDLAATLHRQRRRLDGDRLLRLLAEVDLTPEYRIVVRLLADGLGLPVPDAGLPDRSTTELETLRSALHDRLVRPDELDRRGALAGSHRRDGALGTAHYLLRRLLPPLDQLRAVRGSTSAAGALLGYPRHALATAGRAWRRWRRAGPRSPAPSLKSEVYRRR